MRILQVSFRNLNSLVGEWNIDFTHPEYVSSGIFAITGPTGAGKTTILDAICLALYGQTPRLNKITQGDNEIMSRQTGECSAELEFETAKGRYRCHWSQHRSRKQADGQLQAQRHEIVDAATGKLLETKLAAVARMVEQVTGMDFERFTRSMLLAQGGFAAFLQATPDKRAPILEQITGTAIYSRISIKVHETTAEQRKQLDLLRRELDGMQFLPVEQEQQLRVELGEKQQQEQALQPVVNDIAHAVQWRERIGKLEGELARLEEEWRSHQVEQLAAVPELEIFALARRAVSLEADYAHLMGVRRQQEVDTAELASIAEQLPQAELELHGSRTGLEQAEQALTQAREEQQLQMVLIRQTRELDLKLAAAAADMQRWQSDSAAVRRQCDDYRLALASSVAEREVTREQLVSGGALLEQQRGDAGLVEQLTGMEQQIKTLKTVDQQLTQRRGAVEQQAESGRRAELLRQQADSNWNDASRKVAGAEHKLAQVRAAIDLHLQGRELFSWRAEAEQWSIRRHRLENLAVTVARMVVTGQKISALQLKRDLLEQQQQHVVVREHELARECGVREELIRQLQDKLLLLNRVRDLEQQRGELVDGAPCPLCGALDHPYASGNVPKPDQAQQELELARRELKAVTEQLAGARLECGGVIKELEQITREEAERREQQQLDEQSCSAGLVELALAADAELREALLRSELETCLQGIDTCRNLIAAVEAEEKVQLQATTALDAAREALNRYDKERQGAELTCQAAVSDQQRLQREVELLQGDLQRAVAEVERSLEPFGCHGITPHNGDQLIIALTARRSNYLQRVAEQQRLEKRMVELENSHNRQQVVLSEGEKNLSAVELRLQECSVQREQLASQRRELFGERNPDQEEKQGATAVSEAGVRRDQAFQLHNRWQHEQLRLQQLSERLTESLSLRTGELRQLEQAFSLRLNASGFRDEAAFAGARLPQPRFDQLSRQAEQLQRRELELQARRRDRSASLQQELEQQLTEKSLDQLREEQIATSEQLGELHKSLGAIQQKLQQQAELMQRQALRLQALELQKTECRRWEQLHALIGSSDGKKFRNFAQGLTFELMVAHANRQLQKMSDRYLLVRDGSEPLELNVIDNYQGGEVRSTKNLSGGESFIASLALSLGLSSMASRNVRVDSLFLDEGFGTLDEDALETALETLSGLQQDGKLIGIISHVSALKERIGTQIQVATGSGGRSSISGPGCRQVV